MTEADKRLDAIFAADLPPARDPAFTLGVLHALERRRLFAGTLFNAALAVAAGGLLWEVWPLIADGVEAALPALGLPAALVAVALTAVAILERSHEAQRGNGF